MTPFDFELFADYHQFHLRDDATHGDLSNAWDADANIRMMATAPGVLGIGTARNMDVPVRVEVHAAEPEADLSAWDHVVECSLAVPSGRIVIAGCTDYLPDAARLDVPAGDLRARVSYGGLNTLSADGLDGKDRYRVQLWPGAPDAVRVVKQYVPAAAP